MTIEINHGTQQAKKRMLECVSTLEFITHQINNKTHPQERMNKFLAIIETNCLSLQAIAKQIAENNIGE